MSMRYVHTIVICSCQPSTQMPEALACHVSTWKLPYHYVIDERGIVTRSRPISRAATGCPGINIHAITVAYIGGIDADGRHTDTRTPAQRQAMLQLVTRLTMLYRCKTISQSDVNHTASPGFDAKTEYEGILRQIITRNHI